MEEKKERRKGLDKEKRSLWEKENKVFIGLNLMRSTDEDILDFLEKKRKQGESKQGLIKRCIREMIEEERIKELEDLISAAQELDAEIAMGK